MVGVSICRETAGNRTNCGTIVCSKQGTLIFAGLISFKLISPDYRANMARRMCRLIDCSSFSQVRFCTDGVVEDDISPLLEYCLEKSKGLKACGLTPKVQTSKFGDLIWCKS